MALSVTKICNSALGRIGAKRINNFDDNTESSTSAIQCRTQYEMTRDALLRSHYWRFAGDRATLSPDTKDPPFEYDNQFILPTDFLHLRSIYEDRFSDENIRSYALEGQRLLTNYSTVNIRYTKKIKDVTKFDPLFVEVLVLLLADKFIGPLAGGDKRIQVKIDRALEKLMPTVRALDLQETNTIGTSDLRTWNDARY